MYCTPSVKVHFNDVYKTKLSFMIRSESNVHVEEEKNFPPPHIYLTAFLRISIYQSTAISLF